MSEQNKVNLIENTIFQNGSDIIWNTDVSWDLSKTPARNLSETDIRSKGRTWSSIEVVDNILYAIATSTVTLQRYGSPSVSWVTVYAFNADNGAKIWDYCANSSDHFSTLAIANGVVYFGSGVNDVVNGGYFNVLGDFVSGTYLYALDALSGELIWRISCRVFYSTPVTDNGEVFINSGHSILCIDGFDGEIVWNYTANDIMIVAPTIANGVVYVPSYDGILYVLNATDGNKIWSLMIDKGFSKIAVINGVVYAPSGDGNIYALNAQTGATLWSSRTIPPEFSWVNSTFHSNLLYANDVLYFGSVSDQHIHIRSPGKADFCQMSFRSLVLALDINTGHKIWNYTLDNHQLMYPVSVDDGIIYTEFGRTILGLDFRNGALVWNFTREDLWSNSHTAVAYGVLYAGFSDGQLYAIKPPSAELDSLPSVPLEVIVVIILSIIGIILGLLFYFNKHQKAALDKKSLSDKNIKLEKKIGATTLSFLSYNHCVCFIIGIQRYNFSYFVPSFT